MASNSMDPCDEIWDVAVVGAGVVGCAVARRFALEGARVVVIEAAADILAGASKANSAILHTGFDAPEGSIELACVKQGYAEYLAIADRLGLPMLETGAVVVAWTDDELLRLEAVLDRARSNGIAGVRRIGAGELQARVPGLSRDAKGAVLVPGEHVIDPWSAPLAYLTQAVANGAAVLRSAPVMGAVFDGALWTLATQRGRVRARAVVNCAGLRGDALDRMLGGEARFRITPRKGQFVVFDKAAAALLGTIILPVPTERTKGVVLCPTIFGNLLVGPTAEDQEDRERAGCDNETLQALIRHAVRLVPALAGMPVTATYAGLRPATEIKEYRIFDDPDRALITIGGIRSTGLTASLGIATLAFRRYAAWGRSHEPPPSPAWPEVPNLAEHRSRDWQRAGNGGIVCHCERVTRREIEAALQGLLPAGDFGGLKRRTRVAMGRCQGFHCLAAIADMTRDRLDGSLGPAEVGHG